MAKDQAKKITITDPDTGDIIEGTEEELQQFYDTLKDLISKANWQQAAEAIKAIRKTAGPLMDAYAELDTLRPYIDAELQKPEYNGATLEDLLAQLEPSDLLDLPEDSLLYKVLEAARITAKTTIRATIKRTDIVEFPLDKPNKEVWNLLEEKIQKHQVNGQLQLDIPMKKGTDAILVYALDFENLEDVTITKKLDPTDKRVYIAVNALFNAGNDVITLPQIYTAMGYKGTPGKEDRLKINNSLTKMNSARIYLDNESEAAILKGYDHVQYDGSLLPFERVTAIVNGQPANAAIRVFREPPLISFAKAHNNQITTIDVKLLQSPISKTNANLALEDYLIERISHKKNEGAKKMRMLYATIFEEVHITTTKQKQRAPAKIKKYLDYYSEEGFIKNHKAQPDGVTIYL